MKKNFALIMTIVLVFAMFIFNAGVHYVHPDWSEMRLFIKYWYIWLIYSVVAVLDLYFVAKWIDSEQ